MATTEAIDAAWSTLRGGGLRSPWRTDAELDDAERVWLEMLDPVDDACLAVAVRSHLERSKWWPTPAELLALAPRVERASVPQIAEVCWLGAIADGDVRVALIEQAMAETAGACGRAGCGVECEPCHEAAVDRVELLARQRIERRTA